MLRIGEFSKLSRVSVRMLRHYDDLGLLKPAEIDRFTDYRYYREDQLPIVCRITALKDMGFSLADIVRILAVYDDREKLEKFFAVRDRELRLLAADTAQKLALLDTARKRLRKEGPMKYDVTVKTIPERYAAAVRMTIPCYEDENTAWQVLCRETAPLRLIPAEPCLCGASFPDQEYREKDVDVEIWKTVKGRYPDTEHVRFRTLPAVTAACCTFQGGYEQVTEACACIASWVRDNGWTFDGTMFNIYHVSPHETQDPSQYVTEVCFPVRRS